MDLIFQPEREVRTLRADIEAVLDDSQALGEIASRSHRHQSGFDKIVLKVDAATQQRLRLNIWRKDGSEGDEHIHPHRWNYQSLILSGTLRVATYMVDPSGEPMRKYLYQPPADGSTYTLRYMGMEGIALANTREFSRNMLYGQEHHELHLVSRGSPDTVVTLFSTGSPVTDHTYIFSREPVSTAQSEDIEVKRMSADDLRSCFQEVLPHLS